MSIRGFHIVFITIATLFCIGLGIWVFLISNLPETTGKLALGGGAFAAALGLVIYGAYFYKKLKQNNL